MFKFIRKKLTKNATQIPLFWVDFNLQLFRENGKQGSCMARVHPNLSDDEYVKRSLNELVDYIRDNYDMEDML